MTTKFGDFKESTIGELADLIKNQAQAISLPDLDQLIVDLSALRARFAKIPSEPYPYLSDQLEFLCLFVKEQVVGRSHDLAGEPVGEAAFALIYFQQAA